jgi:hypothetical protein
MRLKFNKGLTPETITEALLEYINENELIIGSVNVFIQLYDKDKNMIVFSPTPKCKEDYAEYVAKLRRKSIKAI